MGAGAPVALEQMRGPQASLRSQEGGRHTLGGKAPRPVPAAALSLQGRPTPAG